MCPGDPSLIFIINLYSPAVTVDSLWNWSFVKRKYVEMQPGRLKPVLCTEQNSEIHIYYVASKQILFEKRTIRQIVKTLLG